MDRLHTISFFVVLLIVGLLGLFIVKPFFNILALGLILAILFYPIYSRLQSRTKSANLSAGLTVALILLILIAPLLFFGQLLFNELWQLYGKFSSGQLVIDRGQIISALPPQAQQLIENVSRDINNLLAQVASTVFDSFSTALSNVASFFLSAFITMFAVFYFLRDGQRLKKIFSDLAPIAANQEALLLDKLVSAVNGVVKGQFLTAVSQGVVASIGFLIFGVPEPIIWGMFTVVAALVPTVGTSLSLVPAVAYLAITGQIPQAIGLAIWAILAVGLIDNVVGPELVGSKTHLHPLLVLMSILGGVKLFGVLGFLIGPITMAILVALIDIYRTDFKQYLNDTE